MAIQKLPIAAVTASKFTSTYIPQNAIDGNPATRWSASGMGNSITVKLDNFHKIDDVRIAFHSGNTRKSTFEVWVSEDGQEFKAVAAYTSGGAIASAEKFVFPAPVKAKYMRLVFKKVTYNTGSNSTTCAIIELEVWGDPVAVAPTQYKWYLLTSVDGVTYAEAGAGMGLTAKLVKGPVVTPTPPALAKIEAAIVGKTPEPDGTYKGTDTEEFTFSGRTVNDDNSILPGKTLKLVADGSVMGSGITDADGMLSIKKIFPEGTYNVVQLSE